MSVSKTGVEDLQVALERLVKAVRESVVNKQGRLGLEVSIAMNVAEAALRRAREEPDASKTTAG